MRALVLEDEPLLAWMIEEVLLEHGIDAIDLAWSESQAVAAAGGSPPDVLIADSHIYNGDAISAVRAICGDGDIPVVLVTVDARSVRDALPHAAIVEKPFSAETLIETLQDFVRA